MTPPVFLRALTAPGWGLAVALLLGAVVLIGHGIGLRWDPFGRAEARLRSAEARADHATADAAARRLEVEGAAELARRKAHHHQRAAAVERATALVTAQAGNAHDASTPLDAARAARLADHDRELCRLAPAVCGASPADPAERGGHALRPAAAARNSDLG